VAALSLVLALPFGARVVAAGAAGGPRPAAVRTYLVRPGDTLWTIAARVSGPAADLRPVVDRIQQMNRGTSVIFPGETLRLP